MYVRDFWASLARRRYLVVLCLLATGGMVYFVSARVPPSYVSTADVVLIPPKSTEEPTANRYLSLGGIRQAVDVLTRSLGSDSTRGAVHEKVPDGTYETLADNTTSAPILIVTAEAGSPAATQKLLDAVVRQVPISLRELQDNLAIKSRFQITSQMVASDKEPTAVIKKQIRAVGAVGALCLLMSAVLVAAVDSRALRLEREKEAEKAKFIKMRTRPPVKGQKAKKLPEQRPRSAVPAKPRR